MIESLQIIAQRAGESILSFYASLSRGKKADDSLLTLADLAAHRVIVEGLRDLDSAIPVLLRNRAKPTSCIVVLGNPLGGGSHGWHQGIHQADR